MPPEIPGCDGLVRIGQGGFASVYRAHDRRFNRSVAVKVLTVFDLDERGRARFERECQAMGVVSRHPHCVTVYDSGFTADSQPYLVMEDMTGGSLAERITAEPMAWPEAVEVAVKLCGAVHTAHQAGVLHRDIKPENVLVSHFGEPKLSDFGIARIEGMTRTATGAAPFTPLHAPPETFEGQEPTAASDVYSLGSTLFALMAGHAAFGGPEDASIYAVIARVGRDPVPDLRPRGVPAPVCEVLEAAMAKNRQQRVASVAELGRRLQDAQRQTGRELTRIIVSPRPRTDDSAPEDEGPRGDPKRTIQQPTGLTVGPTPHHDRVPADQAAEERTTEGAGSSEPTRPAESTPPAPAEIRPRSREGPSPRRARPAANRRGVLLAVGAVLAVAVAMVVAFVLLGGDSGDDTNESGAPGSTGSDGPVARPAEIVASIPVGGGADHVATGDGGVWVTATDGRRLARIDPSSGEVATAADFEVPAHAVAVGEGAVWVSTLGEPRVLAVENTGSSGEPQVTPVGLDAVANEIAVGAGAVWATLGDPETLVRIDPASREVDLAVNAGPGPDGVAVGAGAVWVANRLDEGTVTRIEPESGDVIATIPVGAGPDHLAVGEGAVWVANAGDGTVSRIDPVTNEATSIPIGGRPSFVAVGAGSVWVADPAAGTLTAIDPATNAVTATLPTGPGAESTAVGAGSVWVVNRGDGTVSRIRPGEPGE